VIVIEEGRIPDDHTRGDPDLVFLGSDRCVKETIVGGESSYQREKI
jgi:hypothetical protein